MLPWFQYTVVYLGPIPIQVWGFFVALGIALSLIILYRRTRAFGHNPQQMLDLAFWVIVFGFIGARLFHVLLYNPSFYAANPVEIIKIWQGGLSSYGGFIGALAGFWWYARRQKLSSAVMQRYGNLIGFSALFGWIIARVGCLMIHDHWGRPCDCWLAINTPDGPRLDMALLEIIVLLPLALIFFFTRKSERLRDWYLVIVLIYYGATRFVLDFFRATDIANADVRYAGLTPAQYFSMVAVVWGVWLLVKRLRASK